MGQLWKKNALCSLSIHETYQSIWYSQHLIAQNLLSLIYRRAWVASLERHFFLTSTIYWYSLLNSFSSFQKSPVQPISLVKIFHQSQTDVGPVTEVPTPTCIGGFNAVIHLNRLTLAFVCENNARQRHTAGDCQMDCI